MRGNARPIARTVRVPAAAIVRLQHAGSAGARPRRLPAAAAATAPGDRLCRPRPRPNTGLSAGGGAPTVGWQRPSRVSDHAQRCPTETWIRARVNDTEHSAAACGG